MNVQIYLISKQIHRLTMFIVVALTLVMAGTGLVMKYPVITETFPAIHPGLMRTIHNTLSPIFAGALLIMMTTGLIMYLFPLIKKSPPKPPIQSN